MKQRLVIYRILLSCFLMYCLPKLQRASNHRKCSTVFLNTHSVNNYSQHWHLGTNPFYYITAFFMFLSKSSSSACLVLNNMECAQGRPGYIYHVKSACAIGNVNLFHCFYSTFPARRWMHLLYVQYFASYVYCNTLTNLRC